MLFHYLRGSLPFLLAMDNYINVSTRQLSTGLEQFLFLNSELWCTHSCYGKLFASCFTVVSLV